MTKIKYFCPEITVHLLNVMLSIISWTTKSFFTSFERQQFLINLR